MAENSRESLGSATRDLLYIYAVVTRILYLYGFNTVLYVRFSFVSERQK